MEKNGPKGYVHKQSIATMSCKLLTAIRLVIRGGRFKVRKSELETSSNAGDVLEKDEITCFMKSGKQSPRVLVTFFHVYFVQAPVKFWPKRADFSPW